MYRDSGKVKIAILHFVLFSVFGLLLPESSIRADCMEKYPDADVTKELNKSEYKDCVLDTMVKNYAKLLEDKRRLFSALRPALVRELDKKIVGQKLKKTEAEARLDKYDTSLSALKKMKESLNSWVTTVSSKAEKEEDAAITQQMKAALLLDLGKCKTHSDALARKIDDAKDEITNVEMAEFCKLDFYLRVGEKLNPKISACLQSSD